jgi:uncharacterized protein (DUF2132 family)
MTEHRSKDPLHGVTLETALNHLVKTYGWPKLAEIIVVRCFYNEPSVKSSLKFLRKTPWARKAVEDLWVRTTARQCRGCGQASTIDRQEG